MSVTGKSEIRVGQVPFGLTNSVIGVASSCGNKNSDCDFSSASNASLGFSS
jgi:hypothetical protein